VGVAFRWPRRESQEAVLVAGATSNLDTVAFELPPDVPPGVDGALWDSWAARWQEF